LFVLNNVFVCVKSFNSELLFLNIFLYICVFGCSGSVYK